MGPRPVAPTVARLYLFRMLQRTLPAGFIAPCLPTKTDKLTGIRFNEYIGGDGPTVFAHACKLGLEGIVSKGKGFPLPFRPLSRLA